MDSPLTFSDFRSETWRRLDAFLRARRQLLRELNDQPRPESETAALRGQIAEITFLLAQPDYLSRSGPAQPIEPGDISALY